ncbi:MAG: hypothetical protein M1828_005326 [Chrysothrix sp. TS-e1954]|nr:MAG: hypothetical protein M1828_005326 [Chrysothrix sp. TS-e1954]
MAGVTAALTVFGIVVALVAVAIYFVGIPKEWKQAAEEKMAENMGESYAKDQLKEQLSKLPEADQQKAEGISSGINKLTGGDLKNPLGRVD